MEKVGKDRKRPSGRADDKEKELRDGDLQAGESFFCYFDLLIVIIEPCTTCAQRGRDCYLNAKYAACQFCKSRKTKCSKAPGRAPLLIVHRTPAAPPMDLYVPPEESLETETDISEPSSKILRVSEWAAGVAQAIQDHADALREGSRQRAEQARSAARATVMAAVIQMGSSVVDFREWMKALEGDEEDEEEKRKRKRTRGIQRVRGGHRGRIR